MCQTYVWISVRFRGSRRAPRLAGVNTFPGAIAISVQGAADLRRCRVRSLQPDSVGLSILPLSIRSPSRCTAASRETIVATASLDLGTSPEGGTEMGARRNGSLHGRVSLRATDLDPLRALRRRRIIPDVFSVGDIAVCGPLRPSRGDRPEQRLMLAVLHYALRIASAARAVEAAPDCESRKRADGCCPTI